MDDDLYDSSDWRSFVHRILQRRGLFQRDLARAMGASEGQLSMWLSGLRPLDPARTGDLATALGLDAEGRAWFEALVDLESRSDRARRTALATVTSRLQQRASPDPTADTHDAIANWAFEVLAELVACEGFRPDPRWIAATLAPPISEQEAEHVLQLALRLGRVRVSPDGRWTMEDVRTDSVLPKERARASVEQRRAFRELAEAAMRRPANERHDGSITMALSEGQAELVLARLRQLEQELVQLAIDDPGPRNRVFHLGTQLFPVSEFTDTELDEG